MRKKISRYVLFVLCVMAVCTTYGVQAHAAKKKVPMQQFTIHSKTKTLYVNGPSSLKKVKLKATVKPKNTTNKKLSYKSSKPKVAKVSSKGVITARKAGTTKITVTSKDGSRLQLTFKVKVKKYIYPTSVAIQRSSAAIEIGETAKVTGTVKPGNAYNREVVYSSSNPAVATVSADGTVTAKKAGIVTITAKSKIKNKKKKYIQASTTIQVCPISVKQVSIFGSKTYNIGDTASSFKITATIAPSNAASQNLIWSSDNTALATVKDLGNGKAEVTVVSTAKKGVANITATSANGKKGVYTVSVYEKSVVSVHDPSIVKDPNSGTYYIFGSHRAFAKSDDLITWKMFENNINRNYNTLFNEVWKYCTTTGNSDVKGNLWAPDVIWNSAMNKWCMYMSVNGSDWNSAIVLLTADSLEGNWTYVGPVVYSGFNNNSSSNHYVGNTDVLKVLGTTSLPARYTEEQSIWTNSKMNAIDPCLTYDENGDLYMTYGSWSAGIYQIKLDTATGLRDYTKTYAYAQNKSDPYFGTKIAGGYYSSGEAPYILHTNGYYYLFLSYGGLQSNAGYQMRIFRSKNISGPYVDYRGKSAIYTNYVNNFESADGTGIRLMSNYKFSTMSVAQVAQGHNSAFVDDDGKIYVVYHTRYNNGNDGHQVKVHQMFINKDNWLISAPYETFGETISKTGYSKAELTGSYEYIMHTKVQKTTTQGNEALYAVNGCGIANYKTIVLEDNGKITGDVTGTWTVVNGTPYVSIKIGTNEYKGVFLKQYTEPTTMGLWGAYLPAAKKQVMTFSALSSSSGVCIWGSKK